MHIPWSNPLLCHNDIEQLCPAAMCSSLAPIPLAAMPLGFLQACACQCLRKLLADL
jgi:hypothetical protein